MVVSVVVAGCVLSACGGAGEMDVSGMTESDAVAMPLEEQYELAGVRHRELHEIFADVQREISDGEWRESATGSEVVPHMGGSRTMLPGATKDNSYYFRVGRTLEGQEDVRGMLDEIADSWRAKGWDVQEEVNDISEMLRIVATTPDGYWFAAADRDGEMELKSFSPVYWGDQLELVRSIAARRDAENEAGATWDTTDRNERGNAFRVPGDYRPLPAWDAIEPETSAP